MTLEELAYEAYRAHTGGISLASGLPIPVWDSLKPEIKDAWRMSTEAVLFAFGNKHCRDDAHNPQSADYPDPCASCQVRLSYCPEPIRALVVAASGRATGGTDGN